MATRTRTPKANAQAYATDKTAKTAKTKPAGPMLAFADKLVLNQWLISQFGIDPLTTHTHKGRTVRPLGVLTKTLCDCQEGVGSDNLHHFYKALRDHWQPQALIHPDDLLRYENNMGEHTLWLNAERDRPIEWKFYQWLSLLFAEVYLDRYFRDPQGW